MRRYIAFLLSLVLSFSAYAESFVAKVDRNFVPLGEAFVLTLEYDGAPGTSEPDLSPLNRDFNILSVGRSAQHRNINGVTSNTYQWNISLSPKKTSQIVIPAINFKNFSSSPIKITVSNQTASGTSVPKFSLGRTINQHNPFVQEQVIYTLVIKTTEEIQGDIPQFIDNGTHDWVIKQLSNPMVSSEVNNGIETRNITINYALFPQKSGKLKIPELQFRGYYIDKDKLKRDRYSNSFGSFLDDNFFSGFGVTPALTPISLTAQPVTVDVRPIPSENNGYWWLPSSKVEISSDWEHGLPDFKVGEAVNRKIKLTAYGVVDTQLPKIIFPETPALKQYPETPEYKSHNIDNGIVSEMLLNVVYIPQQGGSLTVPAIDIPWYNLKTNSIERAYLPALNINVKGSAPATDVSVTMPVSQVISENTTDNSPEESSSKENNISIKLIVLITSLAFLSGLLVSWLIIYLLRPKNTSGNKKETQPRKSDIDSILHAEKLKDIRDEILRWTRLHYPNKKVLNLDDVAKVFANTELEKLLQQLSANLYSGQDNKFDRKRLYKILKEVSKKQEKAQKQKAPLPDLYK